MSHASLVEASSLAIAAFLGACGGSERARSQSEAAADSAQAMTASSGARKVTMVMIGKGTANRVTEPTFQFAPQDTVYVSVSTTGSGGDSTVTAAWRSQSGEILQQTSERLHPKAQNASFNLSQPKGLKPGTYKVVVFLGSDSVEAKAFVVKK